MTLLMVALIVNLLSNKTLVVDGRKLNPHRHLEAPSTAVNTCTHAAQYNNDANTVALCKTFTTKETCQKPRYYCPTPEATNDYVQHPGECVCSGNGD